MKRHLASIIILGGWIVIDYFIGIQLTSLAIGMLSMLLHEPLKQKLNET